LELSESISEIFGQAYQPDTLKLFSGADAKGFAGRSDVDLEVGGVTVSLDHETHGKRDRIKEEKKGSTGQDDFAERSHGAYSRCSKQSVAETSLLHRSKHRVNAPSQPRVQLLVVGNGSTSIWFYRPYPLVFLIWPGL
jgi:hypothetical protein